MLPTETKIFTIKEGKKEKEMKKYLGVIIGGLVGGAIVAAIFFGVVLSGEEDGDVSKSVVIDEPAGTKIVPEEKVVGEIHTFCEEFGDIPFDFDCDAVADSVDNCPTVPNPVVPGLGQPDRDRDGVGDACDYCGGEPGPRDNKGCPSECESDNDCDMGLECFREKCSYPCRGALMCPVGMICDVATKYCEGTPQ